MTTKKPFVGSYTKFKQLETCPHQFYRIQIAGDVKPDPMGPEAKEGDHAHRWFDKALSMGLDLPFSLKEYQWALDEVRRRITYRGPGTYENPVQIIRTEQKLGLDAQFSPCGFFDDAVRFRSIADVEIIDGDTSYIYDYKTGKLRPDFDQLEMMAVVSFVHNPEIEKVVGQLLFVKYPDEDKLVREYYRTDLPTLKKQMLHYWRTMRVYRNNGSWPKNRTGLCKAWCPVVDCEHNGRER